jgi:hypothetical protein
VVAFVVVLVLCSNWGVVASVSLGFVVVSQLVGSWLASVCWMDYDFVDW